MRRVEVTVPLQDAEVIRRLAALDRRRRGIAWLICCGWRTPDPAAISSPSFAPRRWSGWSWRSNATNRRVVTSLFDHGGLPALYQRCQRAGASQAGATGARLGCSPYGGRSPSLCHHAGRADSGNRQTPDGRRRSILRHRLDADLRREFADRILPFDQNTAAIWGDLMGEADRRGRSRPAIDAQIAATALQHDLTLATRNTADLADLGVRLLNPWDA